MSYEERKIVSLCQRLASLLEHPEPGLITWHEARARLAKELHRALSVALYGEQADAVR